jgi:hypothetical protein
MLGRYEHNLLPEELMVRWGLSYRPPLEEAAAASSTAAVTMSVAASTGVAKSQSNKNMVAAPSQLYFDSPAFSSQVDEIFVSDDDSGGEDSDAGGGYKVAVNEAEPDLSSFVQPEDWSQYAR